jgi:hypothetical protein
LQVRALPLEPICKSLDHGDFPFKAGRLAGNHPQQSHHRTNPTDLLAALRSGTRCANHYLRRLHNLALGLG